MTPGVMPGALALVLVAALAGATAHLGAQQSPLDPQNAGSQPVPTPWEATDIDGRSWSSERLRGRVVLVDFWATWCAPCLEELPRLRALHDRHASDGFVLLGVSLDRTSTRDFRSWLQRQDVRWPQVRQPGGYDSPLARLFDVAALPASYLLDREGRIRAAHTRGAALDRQVAALMEDVR